MNPNARRRRGAHAARVLVWAALPNLRAPVRLFCGGEKLVERGFRRAAENDTPAACAPRGLRLLTSAATGGAR